MTADDEFATGGYASDGGTGTAAIAGEVTDSTLVVTIPDNSGAPALTATYVSMDADGFTINWTTVHAFVRTFGYIAFQ